jgi:uncharacterized protein
MRTRSLQAWLACAVLATGGLLRPDPAPAQTGEAPSAAGSEILITEVRIPMRDGITLSARKYRPAGLAEPAPVIVTMTPYTSDDAHERAGFFAEHGYVFLNVDVRGRGGSEGEFWPLEQDGPDGSDVVEWAADQPFSDGRVAMRGGSYRGMAQWQTLREHPEALVTAVPTASVYPGWDFPNPSGIFMSYAARWLSFVQGRASQGELFGDTGYWNARYRTLQRDGRPFADLAEVTGIESRVLDRWLEHPHFDAFWQEMSPGPDDYRALELPLLTITGHFDGDQPGALKYYRDHMEAAPGEASRNHYLLMGPWSHAGTRNPTRQLGDLRFGENSVIDMEDLHLEWFDWVLRDGPRPEILRDRVVYYLMETDEWRSAPTLEAVSTETRSWYLSSPGSAADDVFHSGVLGGAPGAEADVDRYTYDPLASLREDAKPGGGPRLVYHSPPLEAPLEVAGYMELEAFIELDVPDTDMVASVLEVRPDGSTIPLGRSELRARHRHGVDREVAVQPGAVELYRFDRFYWFARTLREGSRIRLVIEPLDTVQRQRNYHSGGDPIAETPADARTAEVRLHHGPDHPSRLLLPLAAPPEAVDR